MGVSTPGMPSTPGATCEDPSIGGRCAGTVAGGLLRNRGSNGDGLCAGGAGGVCGIAVCRFPGAVAASSIASRCSAGTPQPNS
ncbi:hypothetical protein ACWEOR_10135, partial [Micromonospora chalcea]